VESYPARQLLSERRKMDNNERFPKELLKENDPDNYLARAIRKLEKMSIIQILMFCPNCKWIGAVLDCNLETTEDVGRLRCPRCGVVVSQIGDG